MLSAGSAGCQRVISQDYVPYAVQGDREIRQFKIILQFRDIEIRLLKKAERSLFA